jgi:hypothetical protein
MIAASLQLLHALYAIAAKYGKTYCYPSQKKLLELLKTHYDISISRRTLNRWLAFLEGEGYIFRTRRHTRGTDGEIAPSTASAKKPSDFLRRSPPPYVSY